nr:MAG TPA: hypothetical protein [Bacteriophage sp.]
MVIQLVSLRCILLVGFFIFPLIFLFFSCNTKFFDKFVY